MISNHTLILFLPLRQYFYVNARMTESKNFCAIGTKNDALADWQVTHFFVPFAQSILLSAIRRIAVAAYIYCLNSRAIFILALHF